MPVFSTFLCRLLADSPEDAIAAFMRMRDNLRNTLEVYRDRTMYERTKSRMHRHNGQHAKKAADQRKNSG